MSHRSALPTDYMQAIEGTDARARLHTVQYGSTKVQDSQLIVQVPSLPVQSSPRPSDRPPPLQIFCWSRLEHGAKAGPENQQRQTHLDHHLLTKETLPQKRSQIPKSGKPFSSARFQLQVVSTHSRALQLAPAATYRLYPYSG